MLNNSSSICPGEGSNRKQMKFPIMLQHLTSFRVHLIFKCYHHLSVNTIDPFLNPTMAQLEFQQLSSVVLPAETKLLLQYISLACSSENARRRPSEDDAAAFDDGFVFDIDPSLLVDPHKLTFGDIIGEGAYSIVYKGWWA